MEMLFISFFKYWIAFGFLYNLSQGFMVKERLACSNGKVTLSNDEALRNAEVTSSVTEYYWKVRYSQSDSWTNVIYCSSFPICTIIKPVLTDGTKVRVSANGTLITLEHRAGGNASGHAQFLFEIHLVKNSRPSAEHHVFQVKFTVICIHTRLAGKANLTKFLLDKLPWDHVTDLKFIDANANEIAYCNIIQCAITVNKNGNDSSLNWTNRFDVEGGALVLTDIKEADNCREFRIEAHCGSDKGKVHIEKIWILVNTSLGKSHSSESHAVAVSTSNTVWPSNTAPQSNGISLFSSVQSKTSVSPSNLTPFSERPRYPIANCVTAGSRKVRTVVIFVIITCIFVFV